MAKAPVHKLGQMIGDFIEKYFEGELTLICQERQMYLDAVGKNRTARKGKKVSWDDVHGNKHDLDFVIERGGSDVALGTPAALIECAWRRYTKHSKNKAQEIQGAILPIAEKYKYQKPFLGAVIAGVYTAPAIAQLNSCGFETIYFEYNDIIASFKTVGVDVRYDEDTTDNEAQSKVTALESLTDQQYKMVFDKIVSLSLCEINRFKEKLIKALDRQIIKVIVAPLYGVDNIFSTVYEALEYLKSFNSHEVSQDLSFAKIFIQVRFSNGDNISGDFSSTENANLFLTNILTV